MISLEGLLFDFFSDPDKDSFINFINNNIINSELKNPAEKFSSICKELSFRYPNKIPTPCIEIHSNDEYSKSKGLYLYWGFHSISIELGIYCEVMIFFGFNKINEKSFYGEFQDELSEECFEWLGYLKDAKKQDIIKGIISF